MTAIPHFPRYLILTVCLTLVGAVAPAAAAPHARLSADLNDALSKGTQTIDVIVHGDQAAVDALARQYNLVVKRYLKSGGVLRVNAGQLAALADDPAVDHLSADARVHSSDAVTAQTIGADQVWTGVGKLKPESGQGVTVVVIDSGVDVRHESLQGRVMFSKDFIGGDGSDLYGHGTHVAGIIAGQGGRLGNASDYGGIAPGAAIVSLRVLDATGAGRVSDVVDAIDWAVDNRKTFDVRVINLSLGGPVTQSYKDDPLCEAVERAVAAGIVVVAAAGNYGVTKEGQAIYGGITSRDVQLEGADAVRHDPQARSGCPRQPHRFSRGSGVVSGGHVSRAARCRERRRSVYPAVRHEHVDRRGQRRDGVAPRRSAEALADRREGGAAGDELVHGGCGVGRRRGRELEYPGSCRVRSVCYCLTGRNNDLRRAGHAFAHRLRRPGIHCERTGRLVNQLGRIGHLGLHHRLGQHRCVGQCHWRQALVSKWA